MSDPIVSSLQEEQEAPKASLVERIRRYLALTDDPEFIDCPRCKGVGYHHGFGEGGVDPDWCEDCGGIGSELHPDANVSPDDLLREALPVIEAAESKVGDQ